MIYLTEREYLSAMDIVNKYNEQLKTATVKSSDLKINQEVRRSYSESNRYWIEEINGDDILLRATESSEDADYDDFIVNIAEVRIAKN